MCSLKVVKYGKLPTIVCKIAFNLIMRLASCFIPQVFVLNLHFAYLFALSVALGFQISLLVACFLDISRLSKYSTNTTISFLQNSRLSERSWPSHFPPKKTRVAEQGLSHFTLDYMKERRHGRRHAC